MYLAVDVSKIFDTIGVMLLYVSWFKIKIEIYIFYYRSLLAVGRGGNW